MASVRVTIPLGDCDRTATHAARQCEHVAFRGHARAEPVPQAVHRSLRFCLITKTATSQVSGRLLETFGLGRVEELRCRYPTSRRRWNSPAARKNAVASKIEAGSGVTVAVKLPLAYW